MTSTKLESEIDALADIDRAALAERWRTLYRGDLPKGMSRPLLIRAIAYAMQAKCFGGLTPAIQRRLGRITEGTAVLDNGNGNASPMPRPGTRLLREWNGASHVVEVVEGGFVWNGTRHDSLSAVARAITGARWSGPRFFGLTSGDAS